MIATTLLSLTLSASALNTGEKDLKHSQLDCDQSLAQRHEKSKNRTYEQMRSISSRSYPIFAAISMRRSIVYRSVTAFTLQTTPFSTSANPVA